MNTPNENVDMAPTQNTAPEPTRTPTPKKKNGGGLWIVVILVLIALGVMYAYQQGMMGNGAGAPSDDTMTEQDASQAVAIVNGVTITRGELNEKAEQIRMTMPDGAADPAMNPLFEADVLDQMIDLAILLERADRLGIVVDEERVDQEIATLIELFGGEAVFNEQLAASNLTIEELRENMRNDIAIRELVDLETNIEEVAVTDEELRAAYDLAMGGNEEGPTFEEMEEIFRSQLLNQKSASIVDAYLNDLRTEATIEIFL